MLRELNPELVGKVTPSAGGKLPGLKELAKNVLRTLNIFRDAYPKLHSGEMIRLPDGQEASAEELFRDSLPLHVVDFAAQLQPGWMGRGYVWLTAFIDRANLDASQFVETAATLFEPLLKNIKDFREAFEPTITQKLHSRRLRQPKNVPMFREWMEENTEEMIAACVKKDWDESGARADLLRVMEALRDAERRKMGFHRSRRSLQRHYGDYELKCVADYFAIELRFDTARSNTPIMPQVGARATRSSPATGHGRFPSDSPTLAQPVVINTHRNRGHNQAAISRALGFRFALELRPE